MWATNEVRKKYDEMRIQHATAYQKHGENACKHELHEQKDETKRRMHIFAAVQLNEEVTENTCLSTNRDELIKSSMVSFCKVIKSNPFLKLFLEKISAKLSAITALTPNNFVPLAAQSRDEPQP